MFTPAAGAVSADSMFQRLRERRCPL